MYIITAKLRVNNKTISIDITGETFEQMIKNAKKKIRNMKNCCFDIITEQLFVYDGVKYCSLSHLQNNYDFVLYEGVIRNLNITNNITPTISDTTNYYINTTSDSTYSMSYSTTDNHPWRY